MFCFLRSLAFSDEKAVEQFHQRLDLGLRAVPVFRGEGIQGEIFHAEVDAGVRDLSNGFRSRAVAFAARQSAFLGPAAVAVHDDCDVAGNVRKVGHRSYGSYRSYGATNVCVLSGPTPTKAMGAPHSSPRRAR